MIACLVAKQLSQPSVHPFAGHPGNRIVLGNRAPLLDDLPRTVQSPDPLESRTLHPLLRLLHFAVEDSHLLVGEHIGRIKILRNAGTVELQRGQVFANPLLCLWQVLVVQIDVQQIDIPRHLDLIEDVLFHDFAGNR